MMDTLQKSRLQKASTASWDGAPLSSAEKCGY